MTIHAANSLRLLSPVLLLWSQLSIAQQAVARPTPPPAAVARLGTEDETERVLAGLFQQGRAALTAGDTTTALARRGLAHALKPSARGLIELAEACQAAGLQEEAQVLRFRALPESTAKDALRAKKGLGTEEKLPSAKQLDAQATRLAQQQIDASDADYDAQRFAEAIPRLALAYALLPTPMVLFNLAGATRQLGQDEEAVLLYQRYRDSGKEPALRQEAAGYMIALQKKIKAERALAEQLRLAEEERRHNASPPRLRPVLTAGAGAVLGFRDFRPSGDCQRLEGVTLATAQYWPVSCPRQRHLAAPGVHLELAVYPLVRQRRPWLQELGLGASADLWPQIKVCENGDPADCGRSAALGLRVQAGLRWQVRPWDRLLRPAFRGLLEYSLSLLSLRSLLAEQPLPSLLPSVRYQSIAVGLGVEVPLLRRRKLTLTSALQAQYLALLQYGPLAGAAGLDLSSGGFGPVSSGHGVRAELRALEIVVVRHLTAAVWGSYERYDISFASAQSGPPINGGPLFLAAGVVDQFGAVGLQVGALY